MFQYFTSWWFSIRSRVSLHLRLYNGKLCMVISVIFAFVAYFVGIFNLYSIKPFKFTDTSSSHKSQCSYFEHQHGYGCWDYIDGNSILRTLSQYLSYYIRSCIDLLYVSLSTFIDHKMLFINRKNFLSQFDWYSWYK